MGTVQSAIEIDLYYGDGLEFVCKIVGIKNALFWIPLCIYPLGFLIQTRIMCFNTKLNLKGNIKVGLAVLFLCYIVFQVSKEVFTLFLKRDKFISGSLNYDDLVIAIGLLASVAVATA